MEMERIMREQYESINDATPRGTNQAYACRVAAVATMECLDIAASSTLRNFYGATTFNDSYTSVTGTLDNNIFVHDRLMIAIDRKSVV